MAIDNQIVTVLKNFSAQSVIRHIALDVEGEAYTNDPNDAGGETKYGMTKAIVDRYKGLWSKYKYNGDMRTLTYEHAYELYYLEFFVKARVDRWATYSPFIAYIFFDVGVNGGVGTISKMVQRFLNLNNNGQKLYNDLKVDGDFGNTSFTALDAFLKARGKDGLETLQFALPAMQFNYYLDISENKESNERFTYGWERRVINFLECAKDYIFIS